MTPEHTDANWDTAVARMAGHNAGQQWAANGATYSQLVKLRRWADEVGRQNLEAKLPSFAALAEVLGADSDAEKESLWRSTTLADLGAAVTPRELAAFVGGCLQVLSEL